MRIRLNGWQRIGVVLSFLWIAFLGFYAGYEYAQTGSDDGYFFEMIVVEEPPIAENATRNSVSSTKGQSMKALLGLGPAKEPHFMVTKFGLVMIAPLVLGWVIAYLCVLAIRWIAAGFKRNRT